MRIAMILITIITGTASGAGAALYAWNHVEDFATHLEDEQVTIRAAVDKTERQQRKTGG